MNIVITGVTRGLGRALAEEFARDGHIVAGCGRNGSDIESLQTALGAPHRFMPVDVADHEEVGRWAADVLSHLGPPALLINNAALASRPAALWKVPREEFDAVVDVNVKGVVNVIRHFVPAMVERRRGVIVNLSSGWGRSVDANVAPYCATKFAIEGMSRAMALELPEGMACVPWSPGVIDTDMLRSVFGDSASRHESPEQWAKRAVPALLKLGPSDNGKSISLR